MQKITPCLWFDMNAEEAVDFYASVFKNTSIGTKMYYDETMEEVTGIKVGTVLTIPFQIDGQEFLALNGGPQYKFTPAVSMMIQCENQEEIDHYWEKLTDGGEEQPCGWLVDKFGISWQVIVPKWQEMVTGGDPVRAQRVMQALMPMTKPILYELQRAYEDES